MRNYSFIILLFSAILTIYSQDTVRHYLNDELSVTDSMNARFIQEIVVENRIYKVMDKDISGKMLNYCEYSSLNPLIENGLAIYYDVPGMIYSKGHYLNGKLTGLWYYYSGNDIIDSVDYTTAALYSKNSDCYGTGFVEVKKNTEVLAQNVVSSLKNYLSENIYIPARTKFKDEYYDFDINIIVGTDGLISCIEFPDFFDSDLEVELIRLMKKFVYSDKIIKIPLNIGFSFSTREEVFIIVEDMPAFRGGDAGEFRKYIEQNLIYPEMAAKKGIQGKVFVQFTVNKKGQVVDVKVVRSVHPLLDAEAIRVIKSSPTWSPGKQRGKLVNVQFTSPIVFGLD
jgi:TonB family protein